MAQFDTPGMKYWSKRDHAHALARATSATGLSLPQLKGGDAEHTL